jgi:hypothetical protein
MPKRLPALSCALWFMTYYFLKFLRPITARPSKPEPKRSMVAGSGAARGASPVEVPSAEVIDVEVVEVKFDLVAGLSDDFSGHPTIPKNIITTYKIINNFFTWFSFYENPCGIFSYL